MSSDWFTIIVICCCLPVLFTLFIVARLLPYFIKHAKQSERIVYWRLTSTEVDVLGSGWKVVNPFKGIAYIVDTDVQQYIFKIPNSNRNIEINISYKIEAVDQAVKAVYSGSRKHLLDATNINEKVKRKMLKERSSWTFKQLTNYLLAIIAVLIFGLIVSRDKYIIENNLQGANIEFTKLLKDKANEFGIIIISTELIVN